MLLHFRFFKSYFMQTIKLYYLFTVKAFVNLVADKSYFAFS